MGPVAVHSRRFVSREPFKPAAGPGTVNIECVVGRPSVTSASRVPQGREREGTSGFLPHSKIGINKFPPSPIGVC